MDTTGRITLNELETGIDDLLNQRHTFQNCEKLAALYTLIDHMYPNSVEKSLDDSYSHDQGKDNEVIGYIGDSEFLELIQGKNPYDVWMLVDELVATIEVTNPSLYRAFIAKL